MDFEFQRDPFEQLDLCVKAASEKGIKDPNAVALATAGSDAKPSVRIVLYKGRLRGGLSFYTNYEGRKGQELLKNPEAAFCFYWPMFDLQVRVEGAVKPMERADSEAYFRGRPRLSQVGAWASHQSEEITGIEQLQKQVDEIEARFAGKDIPCPPHWGGFLLIPRAFEFWFGREGRLHERYCYEASEAGSWRRFMRSP